MLVRKSASDNSRGRFAPSRFRACKYSRLVGTTTITAILGCSLGFASQGAVRNGDYWRHLGQAEKVTYIEGYTDAMRVGDQKFEGLRVAAGLLHWKGAKRISRQARRDMAVSDIAPTELVEYVNTIYSDPEYHNLEIVQAVRLAIMKSPQSGSKSAISGSQ